MEELLDIEYEASRESPIHNLDGRTKLISFVAIIFAGVLVGRTESIDYLTRIVFLVLLLLYIFLLVLISRISLKYFFLRAVYLLPFGGFIILFRPLFIHKGNVLLSLPLGMAITAGGVIESLIFFQIFLVSLLSAILLSSTTTFQDMINSARRMGLPRELAMLIGMTLRYLFLSHRIFIQLTQAQATRGFSIRNRKVSYSYIIKNIGYTVLNIFLRSYKRGMKIYESMASRGYSSTSELPMQSGRFTGIDWVFLALTLSFIAINLAVATRKFL